MGKEISIESRRMVIVDYITLPDKLKKMFTDSNSWRIRNDTAIITTYDIIPYEDLLDWDNILTDKCVEYNCTVEEYYGDNSWDRFIVELFKISPDTFNGYEGVVVRVFW